MYKLTLRPARSVLTTPPITATRARLNAFDNVMYSSLAIYVHAFGGIQVRGRDMVTTPFQSVAFGIRGTFASTGRGSTVIGAYSKVTTEVFGRLRFPQQRVYATFSLRTRFEFGGSRPSFPSATGWAAGVAGTYYDAAGDEGGDLQAGHSTRTARSVSIGFDGGPFAGRGGGLLRDVLSLHAALARV